MPQVIEQSLFLFYGQMILCKLTFLAGGQRGPDGNGGGFRARHSERKRHIRVSQICAIFNAHAKRVITCRREAGTLTPAAAASSRRLPPGCPSPSAGRICRTASAHKLYHKSVFLPAAVADRSSNKRSLCCCCSGSWKYKLFFI